MALIPIHYMLLVQCDISSYSEFISAGLTLHQEINLYWILYYKGKQIFTTFNKFLEAYLYIYIYNPEIKV